MLYIVLLFLIILYLIYSMYLIRDGFLNKNNKLYTWNNCKIDDQEKLKNTFNNYGCIIIPDILSENECDELLSIVKKEEINKNIEIGNIHSNYKRKDLILPLNDTNKFIKKIYNKINKFCDDLHPSGKIVESSCLISYPGCYPQIWHTDTIFNSNRDGNLTSFGITLEDTSPNMGPLEVFLESNKIYKIDNEDIYNKYKIKEDDLNGDLDDGLKYQSKEKICKLLKFTKVNCASKKGSLVIWSSKVIHRGGANNKKERPVFYFSLLGKGEYPYGATYSLKKKDNSRQIKEI